MEYFYDKILSNNLNETDKQQLKIVLQKYNNRLQKYKDVIGQVQTNDLTTNKVDENIKPKSNRGRPKKEYTEEEIEALKQKKRDIAKRHYENNIEKRKLQKTEWVKNNRASVNEKARIYRARKKLEKELVLVDISDGNN